MAGHIKILSVVGLAPFKRLDRRLQAFKDGFRRIGFAFVILAG